MGKKKKKKKKRKEKKEKEDSQRIDNFKKIYIFINQKELILFFQEKKGEEFGEKKNFIHLK